MPKATAQQKRDARLVAYARDGHRCQMCGKSVVDIPSSVHHRINRGSGGSALLERPSLLVRLCGSGTTDCHGWLTEHPDLAAKWGWQLPKLNPDIDPETEPILTFQGWRLFDDAGGSVECDPPAGAVDWVAS
jgi:hypothetical protein